MWILHWSRPGGPLLGICVGDQVTPLGIPLTSRQTGEIALGVFPFLVPDTCPLLPPDPLYIDVIVFRIDIDLPPEVPELAPQSDVTWPVLQVGSG